MKIRQECIYATEIERGPELNFLSSSSGSSFIGFVPKQKSCEKVKSWLKKEGQFG